MALTIARADSALDGPGDMEAAVHAFDWAQTPLGPRSAWPQSLRTAVSICLASNFPMIVFWGPELVQIYNDAYMPILGTKHPHALGQPAKVCWAEIWDAIHPLFQQVRETGKAVFVGDRPYFIDRFGFVEEAFFTFSYSPIQDESGGVGGVLEPVTETTGRMLGERRMQVLRDLSAQVDTLHGEATAIQHALEILRTDLADVPAALLYLFDEQGHQAHLHGTLGLEAISSALRTQIDLAEQDSYTKCLALAMETGQSVLISDLRALLGALPDGPWPEPTHQALALPLLLPGQEHPSGVLVSGISPWLHLDEPYRDFLQLAAGQVATAITSARAYMVEKQRAEDLVTLDRAKTTFFNNISHEFRTPLTLLLGPVADGLADAEEPLPPRQRTRQEIVQRNAVRLLKLVNSLLDFARLEAGRVQAEYQPTDLARLTRELASHFFSAAEQAKLDYVVDCPPLAEPVFVDPGLWEQMVLNLIANALKYTLQGRIAITLHGEGSQVVLEVRDTGIGIPADAIPHLFERFYRVQGTSGRTHEGTGIGLALVHELVKLHGGTITVESIVGQGSAFTVTIPFGTAHLPADQIRQVAHPSTSSEQAHTLFAETTLWQPPATVEPMEPSTPGAPHLLLVEDNPDMGEYLSQLLKPHYYVTRALNGRTALEFVRTHVPDLVLSDVMMPEMDGFALLRHLRADPRTRAIPIILLSARAGEEATVEGLEAGADDYLVKPFSARELLTRVAAHLELARLRRDENVQREANRRMNDFLIIASHELRTPLTTMQGNAQLAQLYIQKMLQDGDDRDTHLQLEEVQSMMADADQQARRINRLVNNMLDMARIDGGYLHLHAEPINLVALVREVVLEHQRMWPGRTITLQTPHKRDLPVTIDGDRISQVVASYLSNALKYASAEAPISITVRDAAGQARVEVRDRGPGLPPEEQQMIWERFYRVKGMEEQQGSEVGLGLGLYLSKIIIAQCGGEVGVESHVGQGSTFWFTLPHIDSSHPLRGK